MIRLVILLLMFSPIYGFANNSNVFGYAGNKFFRVVLEVPNGFDFRESGLTDDQVKKLEAAGFYQRPSRRDDGVAYLAFMENGVFADMYMQSRDQKKLNMSYDKLNTLFRDSSPSQYKWQWDSESGLMLGPYRVAVSSVGQAGTPFGGEVGEIELALLKGGKPVYLFYGSFVPKSLMLYEDDQKKGEYYSIKMVNEVLKKAQRGDPVAQRILGKMFWQGVEQRIDMAGIGLPGMSTTQYLKTGPDYKKSVEWTLRAALGGDATAQFNLAVMYQIGREVNKDHEEAIKLLAPLAERGFPRAQYHLALSLSAREGGSGQAENMMKWLGLSAGNGSVQARYLLARIQQQKVDNPQGYRTDVSWVFEAAPIGLADAQFRLGKMYADGKGIGKDEAQAAEWLKKASDQQHVEAQFLLGELYYLGRGVPQNYRESYLLFRQTALQQYEPAYIYLAEMHEEGFGVERSELDSVKWYKLAVRTDNSKAQYKLGAAYEKGFGVIQSYQKAVRWYKRAAMQGYASAQNSLGKMYVEGYGVSQAYLPAYAWFLLAAQQGNELAPSNMERVSKKMSDDQIERAKLLAKELQEAIVGKS